MMARRAEPTYKMIRAFVLERDGWRCQQCGAREHLDVHHLLARSRGGPDEERNLMTLCRRCHREFHEGTSGDFEH
jgi:5-methylcytosine-specific restriction endonuclease McrA